MSREPFLVVMAAGIGSRFGGLKQIEPVGPNGELIIDYSLYDALKAGFKKVIFIINHNIEKDFKEIIGNRFNKHLEVQYAYQELWDLPDGVNLPKDRVKPLGTAHAIYTARNLIDSPFAVINADDYYGYEAFEKIYNYLSQKSSKDSSYAMVGYKLKNTITDYGYVSRGICSLNESYNLIDIVERTRVEKRYNGIAYKDEQENWHYLNSDTIVSMNMWGFTPTLLNEIEIQIKNFFLYAFRDNPLKCEYFLPYVVDTMIKEKKCSVKVLTTTEKWYGVTYSQDKLTVVNAINQLIFEGKYPKKLWQE